MGNISEIEGRGLKLAVGVGMVSRDLPMNGVCLCARMEFVSPRDGVVRVVSAGSGIRSSEEERRDPAPSACWGGHSTAAVESQMGGAAFCLAFPVLSLSFAHPVSCVVSVFEKFMRQNAMWAFIHGTDVHLLRSGFMICMAESSEQKNVLL